ncbi:MAG: acetylglutamate kinase [Taibaiella sp.]|jgi:acetylglutamate kinase
MKLSVIKIGGNVLDDEQSLMQFLNLFASVDGAKILVHGGGKLASQLSTQLNIPAEMVDGRRVTDVETLKIITMVYAGYINKNIVAQLQSMSCNAIGLSGADGNLIKAHKRINTNPDYGFAGDVDEVNSVFIKKLLEAGLTLVIAPVTHDQKGQLLNTNADTIAQEIAQAMSKVYDTQLIYCFEKNGVLKNIHDNESNIPFITKENKQQLISEGIIHSGMLPKIHNAFEALNKGVHQITIGKWDKLSELIQGISGTIIKHV